MSKLYKELKYDTDRVMQPGDPLTSFDGNTAIKAGNATGKGFIETYGDPVAYSYEVTVDIPQVQGASCRVRIDDTCNTTMDITILSIAGWSGATASGSDISVNGSNWGHLGAAIPYDEPPAAIIPTETSDTYDTVIYCYHGNGNSQLCTSWSNLVKTRQTTSKEISTEGHTHTEIVSPDGNTSVQAVNGGKATITMPGLAEPGASLSNDVTLADLIQLLDLPETSTLDDVRSVLGLSATATLYDASVTPVTKALVTFPVKWEEISNKPTSFAPAAHEHSAANITSGTLSVARGGTGVDGSVQGVHKVLAAPSIGAAGAVSFRTLVASDIPDLNTSKLTAGTLGVARGGTGKSSHTINSVIVGGTSTTGALQNVAAASGAFYSTGANVKPQFGTLPVEQGGTGATSASAALTVLGAASTSDATINLQFSDWNFDTTPSEGHYTVTFYEDMDGEGTPGWQFLWYDQYGGVLSSGDVYTSDRNATYLDFSTYTPSRPGVSEHIIATRSLIGYRLGPVDGLNQDKHLAMANHTHSSLTDGTYTVSIPTLSSNGIMALDGHTHPTVFITYSDLVALRNSSQLIPGMTYRITDYTTTTSTTDTQSAGHDFDVLVVANSVSTLNENARAIMHETIPIFDPTEKYSIGTYVKYQNTIKKVTKNYTGTFDPQTTYNSDDILYYNNSYYFITSQISGVSWEASSMKISASIGNFLTTETPTFYFFNCNLSAWKLKYCLDNDTTRFGWADSTNGKGVIYEMEDEWGNRCGYDFKNIQFKRYKITGITSTMLTGYTLTDLQSALVYSSSSKVYMALSTSMSIYGCDSVNVDSTSYQWCYTFSTSITDPSDASLNGSSRLNRIGSYIYATGTKYTLNNIVMRGASFANEIEVNCYNMTFKGALTRCHISDHCSNFTMGGGGYSYIDSTCDNIVLSGNALTAGRDLHIGSGCSNIVSGLRLQKTTIGSGCKYISFGRYVMYCNIGAACQYIHFGSSTESKSYYEAVTIEPENQYIYLDCTGSTSTSAYYKNVTIGKGVNNTTTWKTITDANTNQNYETIYQAENSLVIPV